MCDTIGHLLGGGRALFAKNSDRSPNEAQVNELFPAADHTEKTVHATYIEIEQVAHTHAFLLSRPVWIWGGEMGVNEHGVCIGNEAVFTKGPYGKTGLLGMDLLRLGLERGDSALSAMNVIIAMLERYGQGGNCKNDGSFYYDNSFMILDRETLFVLETAGKAWVYKRYPAASISNRLSIGADGDRYSAGAAYDFCAKHLEPVYSHFAQSAGRKALTTACALHGVTAEGMIAGLRTHAKSDARPLCEPAVGSPCMHAGGLIGDQTTASMVVELGADIRVWVTGSSAPCISLFKPWGFGNSPCAPVFAAGDAAAEPDWQRREDFYRAAIGRTLPTAFYVERDALELRWYRKAAALPAAQWGELSAQAAADDAAFYERWRQQLPEKQQARGGFLRYWSKQEAQRKEVARY